MVALRRALSRLEDWRRPVGCSVVMRRRRSPFSLAAHRELWQRFSLMRKARARGEAANIQRTLGRNVLVLRDVAGMSQEDLAKRASLSRGYISRIEGGLVNVTLATVVRLARVFDVSPLDLLTHRTC